MKYTTEQLQAMAETALQARANGDVRYGVLVTTLSARFGLPVPDVELRIVALAQGLV